MTALEVPVPAALCRLPHRDPSTGVAGVADYPQYERLRSRLYDGLRGAYWKNRTDEAEKPLEAFLQPETVKLVYTHGHPKPELISPDNWNMDLHYLDRPNARRVQLDFFYDYRTNVQLYPKWQAFLRDRQPRTIIFWGQDDIFFTREGGEAYLKDLPKAEMHG